MIRPVLSDDALLADVARARREPEALHLWWLGQSGFLVQWQGAHALLDPYLSDSLSRKYADTVTPHVRMTERVIDPARLDFIGVVTSTHGHTDHLDPDTLRPLVRANPALQLLAPASAHDLALERAGITADRLVDMDDDVEVEVGPFRFLALPSAHETLEQDAAGHQRFLGYVVEAGPFRLYHSGDTVRYPGLAERLLPFTMDVALLPINGRAPERRVAGNLDGPEAAQLAWDIGARLVVPCHFEMFEFNTASPDAFIATCQQLDQPFQVLRAGARLTMRA